MVEALSEADPDVSERGQTIKMLPKNSFKIMQNYTEKEVAMVHLAAPALRITSIIAFDDRRTQS